MADKEINTDGGTFVGKNVNVGEGDFVGRDKTHMTNQTTNSTNNFSTHLSGNLVVTILSVLFLGVISLIVIFKDRRFDQTIAQPTAVMATDPSIIDPTQTVEIMLDEIPPITNTLAGVYTEQSKVTPFPNLTQTSNITVDGVSLPDSSHTVESDNPCKTNIRSPTGSSVQVLEIDGSRTSRIITDKQEVIVTGRNDTDTGIIFGVTDLDGYEIGWIRDYNLANVSVNCSYYK